MKEYKILTQKRSFFSSKFDPRSLKKKLNALAQKGWQVHSMTPDSAGSFGQSKELIVLLERESEQ